MRELDEPNPELEKYVMNSIMSALDIDSMDDDFKDLGYFDDNSGFDDEDDF